MNSPLRPPRAEDGDSLEIYTETMGNPDSRRAGLPDDQPATQRRRDVSRRDLLGIFGRVTVGASVLAALKAFDAKGNAETETSGLENLLAQGYADTARRFINGISSVMESASGELLEGSPYNTPEVDATVFEIASAIASRQSLRDDSLAAYRYALEQLAANRAQQSPGKGGGKFTVSEYVLAAGLSKTATSNATNPVLGNVLSNLQTAQRFMDRIADYTIGMSQADATSDIADQVVADTIWMARQTGGSDTANWLLTDAGQDPSIPNWRFANVPGVIAERLSAIAAPLFPEVP